MKDTKVELIKAYYEGMRDGVQRYAHWKDGVQYVGTTGRSLKEALVSINMEEKEVLSKYEQLEQ